MNSSLVPIRKERGVVFRPSVSAADPATFTLRNRKGWEVLLNQKTASLQAIWVPDQFGSTTNILAPAVRAEASPGIVGIPEGIPLTSKVEGIGVVFTGESEGSGFTVRYEWSDDGALTITSSLDTPGVPWNPLADVSWNLSQRGEGDVALQELQVNSGRYLRDDEGRTTLVSNRLTPLDFRFRRSIGHALPLLAKGHYDHDTWLVGEHGARAQAAIMKGPESGRNMTLWTNQPVLRVRTLGETECVTGLQLIPHSGPVASLVDAESEEIVSVPAPSDLKIILGFFPGT